MDYLGQKPSTANRVGTYGDLSNLNTLTFNSTNLTGTSYNGSSPVTVNTIQDITTASNLQFAKLGIGTAPSSLLHISGNVSVGSSFGTSGTSIRQDAATYTSSTSTGTIATGAVNTLGIPTLADANVIVGGSGYANGTYTSVPLTGGTGTGKIATIIVAGGIVTTVTVTTPGSGYVNSDTLSASNANLGGSGSGFTYALGTTLTNASTLYLAGAPVAGTNITISNAYSIYAAGGLAGFAGGLTTGNGSGSNLGTAAGSASSAAGTSSANMQVGGATVTLNRVFMSGTGVTTVTANASYTNLMVGSSPIAISATGGSTHPVFANVVVNPVGTITGSGSTLAETTSLYVNGATTGGTVNYAMHISGSTASSIIDGKLIMGGIFRKKGYTVSTLPAGTQGDCAFVTDATSPTAGGTLTGSGSAVRPVFHNGTAWVSMY